MPRLTDEQRRKKLEQVLYNILDVETTGLEPRQHRMTEFGAQRVSGRRVESELSQLINPDEPIPKDVEEKTGITNEMVSRQPKFKDVGEQLHAFMQGGIAVAHNAQFDISFLYQELARAGINVGTEPLPYIDTLKLARTVYGSQQSGFFKLGNLARSLGIEVGTTHRALSDVDLTRQVLDKLIGELKRQGITTAGQLEEKGAIGFYQPTRRPDPEGFAKWSHYKAYGPTSPASGQGRADAIVDDLKGMNTQQARSHLQRLGIPTDLIPMYLESATSKGHLYSHSGMEMNAGRFMSSSRTSGRQDIGNELAGPAFSHASQIVRSLEHTPEKHREEVFSDRTQRLTPSDAYAMRQYLFERHPEIVSGLTSPDPMAKVAESVPGIKRPKAQVPYTGPTEPSSGPDDYMPEYIPGGDDDYDPVTGFASEYVPPTPATPTPQANPFPGRFDAKNDFSRTGRVTIDKPHVNMSWDFLKELKEIRYQGKRVPVSIRMKPVESEGGASVVQAEFTANRRTFSKRIEATPGGFQVDGRVIQYQQISPYSSSRGVMPQRQLLKAIRSALTYAQGAEVNEYTTPEDLQRIGQSAFAKHTEKFPGIPRNWHAKLKTEMGGEEGATWYKWSPQFMARMFAGTQIRTSQGQRRNAGEFGYYDFPGHERHVSRGSESSPIDIDRMGRWMAWPIKAFRASSEVFTVADPKKAQDRYIAGFDARKAAKRLQIGAQEIFPLLGRRVVESPFQLPGVPLPGRGETFMPPKERGQVIRAAVLMGGMLPEGMGQVNLPDTMEERFKSIDMPTGEGGGLPRLGKLGALAGRYSKLLLGEGPQGESVHHTTGDWDTAELISQYVDESREGRPALASRILQRVRTGDSTTSFKAQGMKALEISGTLPGQLGVEAVYPAFKNAVGFAHGVLTGFARGTEKERAIYDALKEKYGFSGNWGGQGQYEKIMGAAQEAVRSHTVMAPYRLSIHESMLEAQGLQRKGDRLVPIRGGAWEFGEGEAVSKKDLAAVGLGDYAAPKTKAGLMMSRMRQGVPGYVGNVWDVMMVKPTYMGPMLRQARREYQGRQPFLGPEELQHIAENLSPDFAMQLRREGMKTTGPRAELWQSYESMPWRGNADRFRGSTGISEKDVWSLAAEDQKLRGREIDPISRRLRAMQKVFGDQTIRLQMPNKRYTVDLPSPNTVDAFGAQNELGQQKNPLASSYVELISAATQGTKKDYGRAFNRYYRKMTEMVGSQEFQRKLGGSAPRFAYEGAMGSDVALGPRQVVYSDAALARLAGLQFEDGGYDKKELASFKQHIRDRANEGNPLLALTFRRPTSHAETQFGSAVTEILTQEMGVRQGMTARGATVISTHLAGLGKGDVDADRYMSLLLNQGRVGYWRGGKGGWDYTKKQSLNQEWVDLRERTAERPSYIDPDADYFRPMIGLSKARNVIDRLAGSRLGVRQLRGWDKDRPNAVGESLTTKWVGRFQKEKYRTGWWEIDTPDWARAEFETSLPEKLAEHFKKVGGAREQGVFGRKTPWWNEMEKWRQEQQNWDKYAQLKRQGSWSKLEGAGGIMHSMTPGEIQQSYVNEMLNKGITMSAPYNMGRALKMMGTEGKALGAFTAVAYQFGLDKALGQGEGEGPEGLKDLLSMWQSFTPYGGRRREGSFAKLFDPYHMQERDQFGRLKRYGRAGPSWQGRMYGGPAGLASSVMEAMSKLATETLKGHDAPPMRAEHVAQLLYGEATEAQIAAVRTGDSAKMIGAVGGDPTDLYRRPTMLRAIAARRAAAASRNRGWAPPQGNTWQPIWDDLVAEGRRINESTALVSRSYGVEAGDVASAFHTYGQMPGGPGWLAQDVFGLSGMQGYMPDPSRTYQGGGPVEGSDALLDWLSEQMNLPKGERLISAGTDEGVLSGYTMQGLAGLARRATGRMGSMAGMTQEEIGASGAQAGMQAADISTLQHIVQQFQARPATQPSAPAQRSQVPWAKDPNATPDVIPLGNAGVAQLDVDPKVLGQAIGEVLGPYLGDKLIASMEQTATASKRAAQEQMGIKSSKQLPDPQQQEQLQFALGDLYTEQWGTMRSVQSFQRLARTTSNSAANQIEQMARDLIPGVSPMEAVGGLPMTRLQAHLRATNRLSEFAEKRGWELPAQHGQYQTALASEMVTRKLAQATAVPEVVDPRTGKQIASSEMLQNLLGTGGIERRLTTGGAVTMAGAGMGTLAGHIMTLQGAGPLGQMSEKQLQQYSQAAMGVARSWATATGEQAPAMLGYNPAVEASTEDRRRFKEAQKLATQSMQYMGKEFGLTADEAKEVRGVLGKMTESGVAERLGDLPKHLTGLADAAEQQQEMFKKYGDWAVGAIEKHAPSVVKEAEAAIKRGQVGPATMGQLEALQKAMVMGTAPGREGPVIGGAIQQQIEDAGGMEGLVGRAQLAQLEQQMAGSRGGRVRTAAEGLLSEFSIGGTAFRMMAVNRLLGQPVQQWMGQAGRYAGAQSQFAVAMGGGAGSIMATPLGSMQAYQARMSDFQTGMGEAALMSRAGLAGIATDIMGGGSALQTGRGIGRLAVPLMGGTEWALKGGMIAAAIGHVGGMLPASSMLGGAMTGIGALAGPIALGAGALMGGGLALGEAYQMSEQQNVYREMMEAGLGYRGSPISLGTRMGMGVRALVGGSTPELQREYERGAKAFSQSAAFEIAEASIHIENMDIPGLDASQKMELAAALEFAGVKPGEFAPGGRGQELMRQYAPIQMIGGTERMVQTAIQAGGAMGISPGAGLGLLYDEIRTRPELQTQVGQYNLVSASQIIGSSMGELGLSMGPQQVAQLVEQILPRLEAGESASQIAADYQSRYATTDLGRSLGFTGGSLSAQRVAATLGEGASPAWKAQVSRTAQELVGQNIGEAYGWDLETLINYAEGLQQERDETGILPGVQMMREAMQAGTIATGGYAPGSRQAQIANRGAPTDFVGMGQWQQAQGIGQMISRTMGLSPEEQNYFTQNAFEMLQAGALPETLALNAQAYIGQDPAQMAYGAMAGFASGGQPYTSQQQAARRTAMAQFSATKLGYSAMLGGLGSAAQNAVLLSRAAEGMTATVGGPEAQPLMVMDDATGGIYGLNQLEQRELGWESLEAGQAFQSAGFAARISNIQSNLAYARKMAPMQMRQAQLANQGRMLGLQQSLESANLQYAQGMERADVQLAQGMARAETGYRQGMERADLGYSQGMQRTETGYRQQVTGLELGFRQGTERLETGYRQQQEAMDLNMRMWGTQTAFQRQQMGVEWQGMMQAREWGREDMAYNRMISQRSYGWQMEDLDRSIRFATGRQKQQLIRQRERAEETFATDTSRRKTEEGRQETVWQQEEAQFKARQEHFESIKSLETEQFEMQQAHMTENYEMSKAHSTETFEMQMANATENYEMSKAHMTESYNMQKAHMTENFNLSVQQMNQNHEMSTRHMTESHAMRTRHINEQMGLAGEQNALQIAMTQAQIDHNIDQLEYQLGEAVRTKEYYEDVVFPNQREQKRLQDEADDAYAQFLKQQWLDLSQGGTVWNAVDGMLKHMEDKANEIKRIVSGWNPGSGGGKERPPHPDPEHPDLWYFNEEMWAWMLVGSTAVGGDVWPGELSVVGEQGPELLSPIVPTRVTPNYLTMAALTGGSVSQGNGSGIMIGVVNIKVDGVSGNPQEIAAAIRAELESAVNDVAREQRLRGDIWQ